MYHCCAFNHNHERPPRSVRLPIIATSLSASIQSAKSPLDADIAAQFTIQVCTSTSCTRKLNEAGLDQYHVLGEIYAQAQSANLEKCMIIEDGGCQGGKNCKMGELHGTMDDFLSLFFGTHLKSSFQSGPCVAILHDDFEGNVALDGMKSNEFLERV